MKFLEALKELYTIVAEVTLALIILAGLMGSITVTKNNQVDINETTYECVLQEIKE